MTNAKASDQAQLWEDMVKTALLGTERQRLPQPQGNQPIDQLLSQINHGSPEEALLDMIATLSIYQALGQQPAPTVLDTLQTAPADHQPLCSKTAGQMLSRLLFSHHRDVLPEFLACLAETNQRIPPQYLPALLNYGRRAAKQRPLILAVIGERGRWLANHNSQWEYAAVDLTSPESISQQWRTSEPKTRQYLFQILRHHNPDLSRQLIKETWPHEKQPNRGLFIRQFEINLSMADEPFLEEVGLNDPVQQVRRKAAEWLAHLPQSRLCQRMAERTKPHLKWFWLSRQVASTLPKETTPEMIRDGITQRTTRSGMGQQSWRLTQMLAATPLDIWETAFETSIENILLGLKKNKWRRAILRGWTQAAARQKNSQWALAILRHSDLASTSNRSAVKLVAVLPPADRETFALEMAEQFSADSDLHRYHPFILVLEQCKHQWSETLTQKFIGRLLSYISAHQTPRLDQLFIKLIQGFARHMPPAAADEIKQQLLPHAEPSPTWRPVITEIVSTLKFRQEMYAEILPNKG